jgi:molybdopterin/thiamine biosynthesis adenylyltransferase
MELKNTTVYIVGVGGTGGRLCELLADYISFSNNRPRRLVLVDDDKVEERNAERQCFDRLDAGKYKVEVMKNRLIARSGFGNIEALPVRFTPETLPHDLGIMSNQDASVAILICVDSARARNAIWSEMIGRFDPQKRQYIESEIKYKGNFLIVDGGNTTYTGQVTTCLCIKCDEFECILGQDPRVLFENVRNADPTVMGCAAAPEEQVQQTVMANMQVATCMFNEFIAAINTHSFYPLVKFDLEQRVMFPVGTKCDLKEEYLRYLKEKAEQLEAQSHPIESALPEVNVSQEQE